VIILEELEKMTPDERIKYWKDKAEAEPNLHADTKENQPKKYPIDKDFINLGEFRDKNGEMIDYAFSWTLWDNNVVLSNLKRPAGSKENYDDSESIRLTAKKLAVIIPHISRWFHIMRNRKESRGK